MVIEQYPDTLIYEDQHGDQKLVKCRFRPIKGNVFVRKQDGTDVSCSFDIAFPLDVDSILLGTIVDGVNERGETFVYQQELLAFHVGALHCLGRC